MSHFMKVYCWREGILTSPLIKLVLHRICCSLPKSGKSDHGSREKRGNQPQGPLSKAGEMADDNLPGRPRCMTSSRIN